VGKNVAVFVDVANIFYAAKAAGVDIDYVTLLKSAIAGRDFVRAYAYTGLDPDNENQRNFHNFLARHDYKVVSKDIRKYGDGKVKANLDIELVVDMMKTARNLDVAIVVSGDGDFAPAIRAVQEMGVRVEVVSFRGNTSSDLIEVADQFTDIVQMAKVEKGSSRSGRRVADDGEDLSMTEVPDKLTEGTGRGRGRGTGRGRGRPGEPEREPVAASGSRTTTRSGVRSRRPAAVEPDAVAAVGAPSGGLVALPGEKLSRSAAARPAAAAAPAAAVDGEGVAEADDEGAIVEFGEDGGEGEATRRRRRRGGRGRGRGRGRDEGGEQVAGPDGAPERAPRDLDVDEVDEVEEPVASTPRGPRPGAFGSVWDSQIGQTTRTPSPESTPFDIDEEDEPAIPEYILAEQRRGSAATRSGSGVNRGGNRGGNRSAYTSAVDRERYGRGGGGGINRYPDVSGRSTAGGGTSGGGTSGRNDVRRDGRRDDRRPAPSARPERERPAGSRSDEPWSEVPPELEAMLRAQQATRGPERPATGSRTATASAAPAAEAPAADGAAPARKPRTTTRTKASATAKSSADSTTDAPPAKPRATRAKAGTTKAAATATAAPDAAPAPKPRTTRAKASTAKPKAVEAGAETAAPKRRTSTRKAAPPAAE
jgi:uncharacterized LabA/DUF88 family protein